MARCEWIASSLPLLAMTRNICMREQCCYNRSMNQLITSFFRALGSLRSGALIKILILSMLLNGALLLVLVFGINRLFAAIDFGLWDLAIDWGATFISGIIAYFVYPLLLPLMISFFDTAIADAIEREEYPNLPDTEPPYWPTLAQDIKFTLKVVLINIVILPLYLLPGVNFLLSLEGILHGLRATRLNASIALPSRWRALQLQCVPPFRL